LSTYEYNEFTNGVDAIVSQSCHIVRAFPGKLSPGEVFCNLGWNFTLLGINGLSFILGVITVLAVIGKSLFVLKSDRAKYGMNTHLPEALKPGRYEIRIHAHVTHVEIGSDGLATGLRYVDIFTGEKHFQPADLVILSGYTVTNVKLLLVSRRSAHPNGIGNDRGQVRPTSLTRCGTRLSPASFRVGASIYTWGIPRP
jgi:hypothetical protein